MILIFPLRLMSDVELKFAAAISPVAVIAAAPTVPVNVGDAESTTLPVPVLAVTPVPPLATGKLQFNLLIEVY
jgi:hypothetical protein